MLTLVTAPLEEPCSLVELRSWCKEPPAEDNGVLWSLMQEARELIEQLWGLQLVEATWRLDVDDWHAWDGTFGISPVSSITSVTYADTAGATQTLSAAVYELSTGREPRYLRLAYEEEWPDVLLHPQSVSVTFKAGWANQRLVPALLRGAVSGAVADWYENRERRGVLPEGAKNAVRAWWSGVT